ncbi:MarR family transcriptional regulator [Brevibacillus laterosporus]|uniref:MarR family transcriptional regulator n=1 Tax=Brevibacillus laterosporus TaxID=1465 RepID=A0A0F7C0C3_BRELA|nr:MULTISPECIES: MarR family transcriptional regulator [Brevibacillus]AKF94263.1 MarR family transcriptional regulator [Brevibacillus laterosporus]MCR8987146.1 MarR family transcriptional regulator [Brevibacillus laterosporus]GIO02817.1 MarR family transcriptional regulator [Brevibacillus halotolerans]
MEETPYLDSLELLLSRVVRTYNYKMWQMSHEVGIYPGQLPVLFLLKNKNGRVQKELVTKMKVKAATVTVMLNRMEKSGLIERQPDPDDLRASRVYLTELGKEKLEQIEKVIKEIEKKCFEGFREEEKILLRRFLTHMHRNLSE